jgi:hypothetical protein
MVQIESLYTQGHFGVNQIVFAGKQANRSFPDDEKTHTCDDSFGWL